MSDMLLWLSNIGLGVAINTAAYCVEGFCVAYAVRKGWDLARKR